MAEAVAALASGRGAVLEIAGDPGMGKTRLLGRLAQLASGHGARVARSTALRGNSIPRQLFRDAWADVPAPEMADADDDEAFRRIRTGLSDWAADPVGVGGVVVFDDVHLADEASTRLLARLIRTPVPGPLLMAIGHCPRRTGSVLLEALDDGTRTGTVVRVELDALDVSAVNQLLTAWSGGKEIDPAYLEQIRAAADGNPRNLRVLTAAGWRPELWPDSPGEDTGALLREGASMAAELDSLTAEETAVVSAAAVLGGPFRPEDVAAICSGFNPGVGLAGVLDALDDLVRADVVRHIAPGARFAFRHPLLGHVAHERAPLPTLLAAHQRALELLKARGAAAVDLARHAEHLVGTDAAAAAPLLARGASEILPDAPETAVRWLRLALQTPVGERPSAERDALMLECCRALSAAGRFEEARALAHDVLRDDTWLTGPLRQRAYAMRVAAERQLGRYDEASAVASAAIEALPRPLTAGAAELAFEYGVLHLYRGTFALARPVVHEVAAAVKAASDAAAAGSSGDGSGLPGAGGAAGAGGAGGVGAGDRAGSASGSGSATGARTAPGSLGASHDVDTYLIDIPSAPEARAAAAVRVLAAFGDAFLGETADAIPALVESARLVDGLPDATAARNPELLAMLGCGEMFMEGYTAASRHLRRCLTIARKGGPQQMKLNVLLGLAFIDQQTGNLRRSEERAEEAGRVARATGAGDGVSMSEALRVGAMVWTRPRAEAAGVIAAAEHAVRIARPGNGWWSGSAAMQLALVRMVNGDAAGCVDALLEGGGGPELRKLQPAYRPMLLAMLSSAALRSGRPDLARQAARDAQEAAEASGLSVQRSYVVRAQAALHAAEGDHDTAAKLFEQAAVGFRRANRPVQHAWTLVAGSASAALALGPTAAAAWLDSAEEVARIHGAARIEEEAAELRGRLLGAAGTRAGAGSGVGAAAAVGGGAAGSAGAGNGAGRSAGKVVGTGRGASTVAGAGRGAPRLPAQPASSVTGAPEVAGTTGATATAAAGVAMATPGKSGVPVPAPLQSDDVRSLLTEREREIAALVATGRRSRAIADELYLSHRTVETHLARIYRKLNVSSRTALAHLLQGTDSPGAD